MNLKRDIKIFWVEHSNPIILSIVIIVGTIFIVQTLNYYAKEKNKERLNQSSNNTINVNSEDKVTKENRLLVEKFIQYCTEEKTEEAYQLLSEECTRELYPTKEKFIVEYYNHYFNKESEVEIIYLENQIFEVRFYETVLESGKINKEDRKYQKSIVAIDLGVLENTVYAQ